MCQRDLGRASSCEQGVTVELHTALLIYCGLAHDPSERERQEATLVVQRAVHDAARHQGRHPHSTLEDLAQDVLVALLRATPEAESERSARGYIQTAFERRLYRHHRSQARNPARPNEAVALATAGEALPIEQERAGADSDPDELLRARRSAERLELAARALEEVVLPGIEAGMRQDARQEFQRTVEELRRLRDGSLEKAALDAEEQKQRGRAGERTLKQASDAVDKRISRARLRILGVIGALKALVQTGEAPGDKKLVKVARGLLEVAPSLRGDLSALRCVAEVLCYDPSCRPPLRLE
jgi:DNA-directed RNA polymerase specialized sigma24 family protein